MVAPAPAPSRSIADSSGSTSALRFELTPRLGRDALLIVANEPLREALVDYGKKLGFQTMTPTTPLDAIQMLERSAARIAYAVVTSDPPWGLELRQLLAHDYPAIGRIALVV